MSLLAFYLRKKFWLKDFLSGSPMWKHYKEIKFINENIEKGGILRTRKLKEILFFATNNCKFYSFFNPDSLTNFPVINKSSILQNYDDFLIPFEKNPGQKGEIHIQKTSGSTGTPFAIPQDTNCRIRRIATLKYSNELIGFQSFEKLMPLRALQHYTNITDSFSFNKKLQIIYVSNSNLSDEKIAAILDVINKEKVKFIRGYMTTLDLITRYAVNKNVILKHCPMFISVGELMPDSLRIRVVEKLKCKIISQYANEESGILGQTIINGRGSEIILNRANCIYEILSLNSDEPAKKGELGRIVVTDLYNHALPLIRYDIGDIACVGDKENGIMTSISNLSGRITDLVYKTNGDKLDIYNSMSALVFNNPDILQWQFIQETKNEYTLNLILAEKNGFEVENVLRNELNFLLGRDAKIKIVYLDTIPVLNSGKFRSVICKLNRK